MAYAFRVRVNRAPRDTLNAGVSVLDLPSPNSTQSIQLRAWEKTQTIKDCPRLVLVGQGFTSEAEATAVGERYRHALMRTLTHLRVGADFGSRAARSWVTNAGLTWLEQETGQRVLNDLHGLMVFPSEPWPRFASASVDAIRGVPQDRFERTFRLAAETEFAPTQREQVSFELFNGSFFQESPDARFLLLVMAVEVLLEPDPRPPVVLDHVESLVAATAAADLLPAEQRDSLISSLQWLRQESINQAGRKLVEQRLRGRTYLTQRPAQFFSECYSVRSRLVHGKLPFPSRDEVGSLAATLEVFVSDLLSGPLVDVE